MTGFLSLCWGCVYLIMFLRYVAACGWGSRREGVRSVYTLGKGLICLSGQEGCSLLYALKRQGSWSDRAWQVTELGARVRTELSPSKEEGELDER